MHPNPDFQQTYAFTFVNCSEIAVALMHDPEFVVIEAWLADPVFSAHLTQLCEEARKKPYANRT